MAKSSTSFKKGGIGYFRNKKRPPFSQEWKDKIGKTLLGNHNGFKKGNKISAGDKNTKWKGDEVLYGGLHIWVRKNLGQPDTCEHCGKTGLRGKQIHWANKDHSYKRNLTDWLRLCAKCHKKYDKENNKKK